MKCTTCEGDNPADARFCMVCGASLELACPSCDTALPLNAGFCFNCGHELEAGSTKGDPGRTSQAITGELAEMVRTAARAGGQRRTITMLFCDVVGSTAAAEKLDPERWAELMNGVLDEMIRPVERYGGSVARLLGDAILAYFGAPTAHEDDPERAVRAALEILASVEGMRDRVQADLGIELAVRIGINTGLVVVGDVGSELFNEYAALGDAANLAARLQQAAEPGAILISEATNRVISTIFEIEDLGLVEMKGKSQRVRCFRVRGIRAERGRTRGIEGLESPLVGREDHFAQLRSAVAAARAGRGGIVSLIAEAGLGKSRLLSEARKVEEDPGLMWVEGACYSYDTMIPFAPFIDLLASELGIGPHDDAETRYQAVEAALDAGPSAGAVLLAEVLGGSAPAEAKKRIAHLMPPQIRGEVFSAITGLLSRWATARPLVVVLEDLHWADPTSIELVESVMSLTNQVPLLLVTAFRPNRDEPPWHIHEVAQREYHHRYQPITLDPLDEYQSGELVANLLRVDGLHPAVRATILDKAEGNPFFVEEVVRSLLDSGVVVEKDGRFISTTALADISVPGSLAAVISTRLDRLDAPLRNLVQTAAVIGREFTEEMLKILVDGEVGSMLGELQRRDLIVETVPSPRRAFSFKHALTADTAYAALLMSVRKDLHRVVGRLTEELSPEKVADLARHFTEAEQFSVALGYLVAAGRQAFRAFAMPDAVRCFRRSLELYAPEDDLDIARAAYEGLAAALEFLNEIAEAEITYKAMLALGEERGDAPMQVSALNKLAFHRAMRLGDLEGAEGLLVRAEKIASGASDAAGLTEFHMAFCVVNVFEGKLEVAAEHLQDAAKMGEEFQSSTLEVFGLVHRANTLIYLTRFEEAIEVFEQARAAADRHEEFLFQAELEAFTWPFLELRSGRPIAAFESSAGGFEKVSEVGALVAMSYFGGICGWFAGLLGRYSDALRFSETSREVSAMVGLPGPGGLATGVLGATHQAIHGPMHTDVPGLRNEARELLTGPLGASHAALGLVELAHASVAAGDLREAQECLDLVTAWPSATQHLAHPDYLLCKARIAIELGDLTKAESYIKEAQAFIEERSMRWLEPRVLGAMAVVAALRGSPEEATEMADRSVADATEMGLLPAAWMISCQVAEALESQGHSSPASHHRRQAAEIATEISFQIDDVDTRRAYLRTANARL